MRVLQLAAAAPPGSELLETKACNYILQLHQLKQFKSAAVVSEELLLERFCLYDAKDAKRFEVLERHPLPNLHLRWKHIITLLLVKRRFAIRICNGAGNLLTCRFKTHLHRGRVRLKRKGKLHYLHRLGLALYPVLVLAAPLPRCGAFLSVPAALPPLVFLTSERRRKTNTYSQMCIVHMGGGGA